MPNVFMNILSIKAFQITKHTINVRNVFLKTCYKD